MSFLKINLVKLLRETADKIEAGTCELSETEAVEILSAIGHQAMSKAEACYYLGISRSKFDEMVRLKLLPKGRKRMGFKELCWWKDELDECLNKNKYGNK